MATNNRRVAAYLPPEVDEAFIAFKLEQGLTTDDKPHQNDSQALILLLSDFLKVERRVGYSVSQLENAVTPEDLEQVRTDLLSQVADLADQLQSLSERVDALSAIQDLTDTLTTSQMAQRIGIKSSTLSHWKKDKTPQQLLEDIRARDPDGTSWVYISDINRFKKESDIPSILQGSLLGT